MSPTLDPAVGMDVGTVVAGNFNRFFILKSVVYREQ
jgi:hypothetical protein